MQDPVIGFDGNISVIQVIEHVSRPGWTSNGRDPGYRVHVGSVKYTISVTAEWLPKE